MIDRATGVLAIGAIEIGPTTSEDAFTRAHGGATLRGVPHDGHTWMLVVRFTNGKLAQITLLADDAVFGTGWDDYTEKKERARRAVHDALLERDLGRAHRADEAHFSKEWTLPWGRVLSTHDPRGGSTDIQILFA